MKKIMLILIATTSLAHLFAQEYYFSSMTPEDSITIYKTDSESKRPPNAEELENLNFSKFLFPHYIRLGDSDTFSVPLDSIDPSFGDIYDNAVMILYNDTIEFF